MRLQDEKTSLSKIKSVQDDVLFVSHIYKKYTAIYARLWFYFVIHITFLSNEGPSLETLDRLFFPKTASQQPLRIFRNDKTWDSAVLTSLSVYNSSKQQAFLYILISTLPTRRINFYGIMLSRGEAVLLTER